MGNVVRPSVSPKWAVDATVNNGANLTANKVEPTATHKSVGYGYPEQPARNHTNWWMNAVYQWVDYIDSWISKWGSINKNFAIDDANTTGLVFAYNAGKISVAVFTELTAVSGTLTLSDGDGTYNIYFDCVDSTVKKLVGSIPVSNDTIIPLYIVPVVAGAIDSANIVDLRTFTTIRKASQAEVLTGTDKDKYVTPFTLQSFATPSATTSVFGKVRLADAADVLAQLGDDVLTAGSLAFTQMRASISKYGTVRLADNTDLLPANRAASDDVLTAASLTQSNLLATTAAVGIVRLADNTDVLLANRAGNTDVLTANSLTQTNMQAATTAPGVIAIATPFEAGVGTENTKAVTSLSMKSSPTVAKFWVSWRYTGSVLTILKAYNVTSVTRLAVGRYQIAFNSNLDDADYCLFSSNTASQGGTNVCIYSSGGFNGVPNDKTTGTVTVSIGSGSEYRDCYEVGVGAFN